MSFISRFKNWFVTDWFWAFLILGLFLSTNRYIYGWDDQHLEIPLLKHLIDPTLYRGDYYVESLKQNFTSYLYPILAKFLKVDQIPGAYMLLYAVSRFVMFLGCLKLFRQISGERLAAVCATLMIFLLGRTEEFLYRTFSHQEFALGVIVWAIYYFYKERFILAAVLFGLAANFHFLYSLFPMAYMSIYLLFFHKERPLRNFFLTGFIFVGCAAPFFMWAVPKAIQTRLTADPGLYSNWYDLFLLACPQNFLFQTTPKAEVFASLKLLLTKLELYLTLVAIYLVNLLLNPAFRRDMKMHAVGLTTIALLIVHYIFTYVHPSRTVLDLNLVRNEQFVRFLLMGYTAILVVWRSRSDSPIVLYFWSLFLVAIAIKELPGLFVLSVLGLVLIALHWAPSDKKMGLGMGAGALVALAVALFNVVALEDFAPLTKWRIWAGALLVTINLILFRFIRKEKQPLLRLNFVLLPLIVMTAFYWNLHARYLYVTRQGTGFWQLQRGWEDMQRWVQKNTEKDALFLIPYNMEMGGFRIGSEREIVVSYRDCGIVGFDYPATVEWQNRISDFEPFKVIAASQPVTNEVMNNALNKYKVNYIVFMRYYAPPENPVLRRVYQNDTFSLYKVLINPVVKEE